MKKIFSRWVSGKKVNEKPYNFVEIDFNDLGQYPRGMHDVLERKIDGFLIRNVLSEDEVQTIIDGYDKLPAEKKTVIQEKMECYPTVFSLVKNYNDEWTEKMKLQQLEWEKEVEKVKSEFPLDYITRLRDVMLKLSGDSDVKLAQGIDGEGVYSPSSIRRIYHHKEAMNLHCGCMFHDLLPEFYKHLREIVDIDNQMSYFIMLQPAESGGELMLFDVEWTEANNKTGETELETKSGKKVDLTDRSKVAQQPITPGRGDMILFAGSTIWHRVETGSSDRMTLGGFVGKSNLEDAFNYWS